MTAEELYAMEAETGRTSEWEPLYRAEKARADAAEAETERLRREMDAVTFLRAGAIVAERDAAEAAVARVRALCGEMERKTGPKSLPVPPIPVGDIRAALDAP